MWNSIEKYNLSEKEIESIVDELWKEEQKTSDRKCPDCAAGVGEEHEGGCDVARCTECGGQRLQCDCELEHEEVWNGHWPGTQECHDQKLVCCWLDTKEWRWDLNELSRRRFS